MSRKRKIHIAGLTDKLAAYCEDYALDLQQYSPYHLRLMDGGFVVLDVWTTGRYYVLTTDYLAMNSEVSLVERGGEKGQLPNDIKPFLDKLFFPIDLI